MVQDNTKDPNEKDFLKSLMDINEDSAEYAEKYFHKTLDSYNPKVIFDLLLSDKFEERLLTPLQYVLEIAATGIGEDEKTAYPVRLHDLQRTIKYFARREAVRELSRMNVTEGEVLEITDDVANHLYHHVESRITMFLNGYCKDKIPKENIFWLRLAEDEEKQRNKVHYQAKHCHECGKAIGVDEKRVYMDDEERLFCWDCGENFNSEFKHSLRENPEDIEIGEVKE